MEAPVGHRFEARCGGHGAEVVRGLGGRGERRGDGSARHVHLLGTKGTRSSVMYKRTSYIPKFYTWYAQLLARVTLLD